jgi:glutathione S-transferase
MTDQPVLWGFDGSTYVRTVRMVLADKRIGYDLKPVNVLKGEPRQPEHLARHPFGKVPVMDVDGLRLRETIAICRYLDDSHPAPRLVPQDARAHALMTEVVALIDSYGYDALVGVAGYHLFPDFLGGQDDAAKDKAMEQGKTLLTLLDEIRAGAPWLAGDERTLADYWLAPIMAYVAMTPDADALLDVGGTRDWWKRVQELESFRDTAPDLG